MTEENTQHPDILHQAGISLPQEFDANATDGDNDGFIQDGSQWEREAPAVVVEEPVALAVEPETLPTVMAELEPEENRALGHSTMMAMAEPDPVVVAVADPAPKKGKGKKSATSSSVPTQLADGTVVLMSKMVFQSEFEKNSNSVRAVQSRLIELGYITAGDDKQGWISVATAEALENFKSDNELEVGILDEELIKALFAGTSVEVLP